MVDASLVLQKTVGMISDPYPGAAIVAFGHVSIYPKILLLVQGEDNLSSVLELIDGGVG